EGSAEMGENTRLLERDRERHYADMEAEKRAFEEHMRTQRQELAREREQMRQDLAADRLARNNALGEQRRMQKQIAEDHLHLLKRVPSGAAAGGQPRAEDLSPARLRELAMQDLSHRRPAQKSAEPAGLPGSSETEVHRLQDMTPEELRRLAAQDAIRMDANLPPPSPKSPPLLIIPPPKPSSPKMVTPPKAATPEPPKAATPEPELTAAPALETEEPPAQSLMDRDTVQDEVQGEVQHEVQATVQAKVQDEVQEKVQNEVQNEVQDEVQDRKEEEGGDEDEEEEEDVSFDMVFEMDIALFDDPDYKQKFEDEYIANMAASAGIDLSAVKLTGIRAGSVIVGTQMAVKGKGAADALAGKLESDSASMLAGSAMLSKIPVAAANMVRVQKPKPPASLDSAREEEEESEEEAESEATSGSDDDDTDSLAGKTREELLEELKELCREQLEGDLTMSGDAMEEAVEDKFRGMNTEPMSHNELRALIRVRLGDPCARWRVSQDGSS
ncbi:hypothetical protein CYMTET_35975, partial [Cymbomonas tetramitiformis]